MVKHGVKYGKITVKSRVKHDLHPLPWHWWKLSRLLALPGAETLTDFPDFMRHFYGRPIPRFWTNT
jgi:hypothetical protein